jgi:hypothetical protein
MMKTIDGEGMREDGRFSRAPASRAPGLFIEREQFCGNDLRGRRNPLKRLDSRKRAWIFLPLALIFLP